MCRILFVDDSDRDVELAFEAFAEHGLANDVKHVRDGAEALDYLYRRGAFADRVKGDPAVVLLDLNMPKVSGMEVLKEIKGNPHLRTIPVVMMTSSREDKDLADSYGLGVNSYVVKPIKFADFLDAVKQLGLYWTIVNEPPPATAATDS